MKKFYVLLLSVFLMAGVSSFSYGNKEESHGTEEATSVDSAAHEVVDSAGAHGSTGEHVAHEADGHDGGHHIHLDGWEVIPFVLLLLMIATGPLFFAHFWHKNYPLVAVGLGLLVVGYYIFALHDTGSPIHAFAEYIQFIALLAGLFMASGGILIKVDKKGKPLVNVALLVLGAVLANLIGTTGASMLLIRPFIRLNQNRVKPYHVMFFIFMVSNVGGSLTPIGDPPLFLGFLKGVPFIWTVTHNIFPWMFAITLLAAVFFVFDTKNTDGEEGEVEYSGKITIKGAQNFFWILLVIGAVFLDPNVFDWVPGIQAEIHGQIIKFSFIREGLMLSIACLSYYFADQEALKGNEFEFEPIKEVAFIFVGIFFTMMPALQLVGDFAKANPHLITTNSLYWLTGALSGVLDNAPTYVNFLTAGLAAKGGDIAKMSDVRALAAGGFEHQGLVWLTAISVASVFFGAMTYIGNAPNFMVKSIAEQVGVEMPSFFSYIVKYSLPILLPILFLTWLIFFYFDVISFLI